MRYLLRRVLFLFAAGLNALGVRIYESPMEKRVKPWFAADGDQLLMLEHNLTPESIVFDMGGYNGQWSSDIFAKYCCFVHVFEPVPQFAENIKRRFAGNKKIKVYPFGLAERSYSTKIALSQNGSSIFKEGALQVDIDLVRAVDFLSDNQIDHIDLMEINIEGGEYALLEHLIECGYITKIKNVQVQFHDFVPDAAQRMAEIHKNLEKTHFLTYQYPFVMENWQIKSPNQPS